MNYIVFFLLLSTCCLSHANESACSVNFTSAEYSEDENIILFWQSSSGILGERQEAYKTESYISNLSSTIDQSGQPLIFWLESSDRDNRLMMLAKDSYNQWATPVVITSSKSELSSLSLIRATDGLVFLAWASDESGSDDVYFTRYVEGDWDDVQVLNDENKVPDILPILSIDNDGSVGLTWRTFTDPIIGYEDKFKSLTSALTSAEMKQVLERQCSYDRPSIIYPNSDQPLFINYYQDVFNSFEKNAG